MNDPEKEDLEASIASMPYPEPSAGFDTRMRARLDEIDNRGSWWTRLLAVFTLPRLTVTAAVLAVALLVFVSASGPLSEPRKIASSEQMEIAEDLELYENFDVIENLDVIEDLELIATMEEG